MLHLTGEANTAIESVIPWLPFIGGIAVALIVGAANIWNRRRGATETKAPTVAEIWAREERVSRHNRWLEGLIAKVLAAFRAYVERVQAGGSTELTQFEQRALDSDTTPKEDL